MTKMAQQAEEIGRSGWQDKFASGKAPVTVNFPLSAEI
jgi:hypothetical protein